MRLADVFFVALRALRKNTLRAGLTILGVVIGIAAVTAMVSIGLGAGELVQSQFENLGINVVMIFPARSEGPVRSQSAVSLTAEDGDAILDRCPSVSAISPITGANGQVIFGNVNWNPQEMRGVGPGYLTVRNWNLAAGTFFRTGEVSSAAKVCVIGQTLVRELFQTTNPIGAQIRVKNIPFRIIGVLEAKGANLFGQDQDDILLMPYTTAMKRLQGRAFGNVQMLMASARSEELMDQAVVEMRAVLAQRHRIRPGDPLDFDIRNTTEISNVLTMITLILTTMLASIASISLLVGGVGIMNIMLVSVTERTREIGLRMALGARPRDILTQFLIESVVLSSIGGLIGVALGASASAGLTFLINWLLPTSDWPIIVSLPAAAVAMGFSALVGVFFGYYPALLASRLDPIEALRYE